MKWKEVAFGQWESGKFRINLSADHSHEASKLVEVGGSVHLVKIGRFETLESAQSACDLEAKR